VKEVSIISWDDATENGEMLIDKCFGKFLDHSYFMKPTDFRRS
jgi:hypothetical protein